MTLKRDIHSSEGNEPGAGIVLVKVSKLYDFKG